MTTPTLDKLLDMGESHARKILLTRREKELQGFYHLIGPKKDAIVPCLWRNDIEKQLQIMEIKRISREIEAEAAMCVHEAWMLKLDVKGGIPDELPIPSQSPDRIEVVQIMAMDRQTVRTRSLQILRDKPGGRIIALIEDKALGDVSEEYAGRMVEGIIEP